MSQDNPHDYYVASMHLRKRDGNSKLSDVTVTIPSAQGRHPPTQDVLVSVDFGKELTAKIVEVVDKAWDRLV